MHYNRETNAYCIANSILKESLNPKFSVFDTKSIHSIYISIGAELGGAAGARAPPLLHNPRKFMIWGEKSPKFPVPALY